MREWLAMLKTNWIIILALSVIIIMAALVWYFAISELCAQEKPACNMALSRQYNNEGVELMNRNDPRAAAKKFEDAYTACPNTQAAINAAVAHETLIGKSTEPKTQLADAEKAIMYYKFSLANEKNKKALQKIKDKITALEKQRVELQKQIAKVEKPPIIEPPAVVDPVVPQIDPLPEKTVKIVAPVRKFQNWKWITLASGVAFLGAGIGFNYWAIDKAGSAGNYGEYENAEGLLYTSYVLYALSTIALPVSGYFFIQDAEGRAPETQKASFLPNLRPDSIGFALSMTF